MNPDDRPLVAHIVHRFDYGGLENGLVNVINSMTQYRHAVIALTTTTDFAARIESDDVHVFALEKRPGKDPGAYARLWRLLRELRPDVLHTRNVGTLDCVLVARVAGIGSCVHGEHGWDVGDPDGKDRRKRWLRRALGRLVRVFIAVSPEINAWLIDDVGIPQAKVRFVCNGVDTSRFHPVEGADNAHGGRSARVFIVGSVTRFEAIKDPLNLIQAFIAARPRAEAIGIDLRLCMYGDGSLLDVARQRLDEAQVAEFAELPGSSDRIEEQLRRFDVFVLGSLREGVSNTLLEAMATGLPVIATRTGGNQDIVEPGISGTLVDTGNPPALADAILDYCREPDVCTEHAGNARHRVERYYSLESMVHQYRGIYDEMTGQGRAVN